MRETVKHILWFCMAALAAILFALTIEYLSFRSDFNFLQKKQDIVFDPLWRPTFYFHIISSMIVLLIGPFQFLKKLRLKYMSTHRLTGKIYVFGILFIAAPTGFIMAFYAEGGTWSVIAFILMSLLWFVTTLMALIKIKQRDIEGHRIWMMRSYAMSFAAVTLRLLNPLFSVFIINNENLIIVSTAWLSWLLNLLVVEGMIFALHKKAQRSISH